MTIYDGGTFIITLRELLFSIIIVLVMLTCGFFISEKISSKIDESNQVFEQATKIEDSKELFEYSMRTDNGYAFVHGDLKAVDTVSTPEIDGEYSFIEKVHEKYTRHVRIIHHSDGKKHWTTTQVYYSWDRIGGEMIRCNKLAFLGHEFDFSDIPLPFSEYKTTIKESMNYRTKYYVCLKEYIGTLYADLKDNTIHKAEFYRDKNVQEALDSKIESGHAAIFIFWIFWIALIGGAVYGFCYLENNWLED